MKVLNTGRSNPDVPQLPPFVCPRCHGHLERESEAYRCAPCNAHYPIVLGIPDFRVLPDPWIGLEDDRAKARRLMQRVGSGSFEDAVRGYWEITPTTGSAMAARYIEHVLGAEARASEWLRWLAAQEPPAAPGCWLDIGCGTADLVSAGVASDIVIVGVDIAMRWLVVAARRASLAGRTAQLVCANGEYLPFADGSFIRALSLGTLEHCLDADRVTAESHRVLQRGSLLRVRTVNRYSVLPEPHVNVWGVGLLPRRWADAYVRWRIGMRYVHHRPLSPREVRRGFWLAGFRHIDVGAAAMLAADRARVPAALRWTAALYERCRRMPLVAGVVRWIAPILDARGIA